MSESVSIPQHIAIIMDGNGRWASLKGKPRIFGHRAGVKAVRDVVRACGEWGVRHLTLYSFSSENWNRPRLEIKSLMGLLKHFLKAELKELMTNNVRLSAIGCLKDLPGEVLKLLNSVIEKTSKNKGLNLILALSYGSRYEILEGAKRLALDIQERKISMPQVNEDLFSTYLYTCGIPDPDLLIRTSGEMRLSNFLLWQISYSELWVTPTLWPDFGREELLKASGDYSKRERRFGGVSRV